ncbi:MAG TPA: hypothetical protein VGJ34_07275 [Gaiellaceae bacterium]
MIPVLLLVGLLAGRWYCVAIAAVVWPLILVLAGVTSDPAVLVAGGGLGAANTAVGVAVHRGLVGGVRLLARTARRARPDS